MSENFELERLAKENDNFRKIIQTQQNTINRMIDHFILGKNHPEAKSRIPGHPA